MLHTQPIGCRIFHYENIVAVLLCIRKYYPFCEILNLYLLLLSNRNTTFLLLIFSLNQKFRV